jgi:Zn-dependent peptidase ImmA (M78 family)
LADLKRARRSAEELVNSNGPSRPPVDAERVARLAKVNVLYASFNDEAKDKVAAYSEPEARVIYVNREQPPERKNYAIAHELAHFMLNPDYVASPKYQVMLLKPAGEGPRSDEEQEAEAFAAELLIPTRMIEQYRNYGDPERLTSLFVAPAELIRARLGRSAA